MEKATTTLLGQWVLLAALSAAAMAAFMLLVGEPAPGSHITAGGFAALKLGSLAALWGIARLGRFLCRRRLLPQAFIEMMMKKAG